MKFRSRDLNFEAAISNTSSAMFISGFAGLAESILFVNRAFTDMTGYEAFEAIGRSSSFLQGIDTDTDVAAEIVTAVMTGTSIRREILNYCKDGRQLLIDLRMDPLHDTLGVLIGCVGVLCDPQMGNSTANEAQIEANIRLQHIASNVPGYVYRRIMKPGGQIEIPYFSPSLNNFLDIAEGVVITAKDFYGFVHPEDRDELLASITRSARDLDTFKEEFRLVSSNGTTHWFRSSAPARSFANGDIVWDGLAVDITAEKATRSELAFLAFHDSLTGLSNRDLFRNTLVKSIESYAPKSGRIVVFFIDLDAFQEVNAALGRVVADDILRIVGKRLGELVKDSTGVAARLGGDEFAILRTATAPTESVADMANSICECLERPMIAAGKEIALQVCVGAAIFRPLSEDHPVDADAAAELMKQADLAMQAAKREGYGSHKLYTPDLDDRFRNRMALRQSLFRSIAEERLKLHYQPLVELSTGRIIGAEALVRWYHPEFGLQRPDLFIPLAEESGFIVQLGAWVIHEAMRQSQVWAKQGLPPPRIAINVSSVQLQKPGFVAIVERALAETGADAHDFELELTEGLLIEASAEILSILTALKFLGFWITIDDFGTGHATFRYLRDFPIDKIKIDQVFVRQLVIDSSDAFIIQAMVALSRGLGIKILAEGIETEMQRNFLRQEGCETGQGYLFSMPLVAEDFGWMIENHVTLPRAATS